MIKRNLEPQLHRLARDYPVITLTGPRQSGKTTLCKEAFPGLDYVNLENLDVRRLATEDPRGFLKNHDRGVILDEIQRVPELPSYIQGIVDERGQAGQFILTGSHQFEIFNTISQSLAGRTAVTRLLPFAYDEIYEDPTPPLHEILFTGFYPRIHDKRLNPTEALSFYVSTYVERDLRDLLNVKDLASFERFLRLCATQVGQLLNYSKMANHCGVDQKTVKSWLSLLQASYIVFLLQPHFNNFRKRLTKSPKLYFYDVGLAAYLLGIQSPAHIQGHPMRGELFENFIIGEFVKQRFNNVRESNLYFFRDHVGNEVDLVLDYGTDLISVEIKSGQTIASDYFKGLDYYAKLAGDRNAARWLIYGGDSSHERSGVTVIPFSQLPALFQTLPV